MISLSGEEKCIKREGLCFINEGLSPFLTLHESEMVFMQRSIKLIRIESKSRRLALLFINLPNTLTLLRVIVTPLLIVLFYSGYPWSTWGLAGVFLLITLTDWLDGWLARRWGQTTVFGAFLDPVADKLIVATALILLVNRFDDIIITTSACVVIGREVVVSALREWVAKFGYQGIIKVVQIAKFKTAAQMTAILILLLLPDANYLPWYWLGEGILVLAVILTLWSMVIYLRAFIAVMRKLNQRAFSEK